MKTPAFWYRKQSHFFKALSPLGWPYAAVTQLRQWLVKSYRAGIPVICVGNLNVGGTGKTPIVIELVKLIQKMDHNPNILTRGYRGKLRYGMVEPKHTAQDVGDEALLLKRVATTWIGRDRGFTAGLAEKMGACCLVMDDGFQNPTLHKDFNLIVIDGAVGFGNQLVLPFGPLRETIQSGLSRAQAVLIIGNDKTNVQKLLPKTLPVFRADYTLHEADIEVLKGKKIIAFAGLGRPEKFKVSLEQNGLDVAEFTPFADHHVYSDAELQQLRKRSQKENAVLVTTEKDFVRLKPEQQNGIMYVRGELKFQKPDELVRLLYPLLEHRD